MGGNFSECWFCMEYYTHQRESKAFFSHHIFFIDEIYKTLLHLVIYCSQRYLIHKGILKGNFFL